MVLFAPSTISVLHVAASGYSDYAMYATSIENVKVFTCGDMVFHVSHTNKAAETQQRQV